MESKINARKIVEKDWKYLKEWFMIHDGVLPDMNFLPDDGLGGVVVEKDNRPIAAAFIYYTNSDIAFLDCGISDPHYKGRDRFEIGNVLIKECERLTKANGCEAMFTSTGNKGLLKRYKGMNWSIRENMSYCIKYIYNER